MSSKDNVRSYFFEISKIVEGAANADYEKVLAYAEQLFAKLETAGEKDAAVRVRQILAKSKAKKFSLARAGGHTAATPVDSESRMTTADTEHPEPGKVDLFLSKKNQREVDRFLQYLRASGELIASGVGVSPSMLIYGPPGCGKTQLARFIASELQLPLLTARTDGVISSYLGSTAKNLRALFEHAASRPCVFFLDEFDAIAKMRDDGRELGELKRVVISLLQNIDALGKDHVLLAATNHDHLLDPAIWRRFAFKMHLVEPDDESRQKMIHSFFRGYIDDEQAETLAPLTSGMTGAQIRQIAEDAIRDAVLSTAKKVSFTQVIDDILIRSAKLNDISSLTLNQRVKLIHDRDPKHFRQARLAKMFGITQPRVSQILRDTRGTNGD